MTLEESREVIPMMERMINQIEEQQNLMAEMVQELQERDRQLLSFQEQNQSLKSLNSELSGLLNLLPDTEELLSQIEQQKTRIEQLETENQQWQELTQKLNSENSLLQKQNRADSFGQLSSGIPNRILSGIMYWLIAGAVIAILFVITGLLIIGIGYQVGKIYRKYCWDIISIMVAITSTAITIYFGGWIKSIIPINLITLLLLVHVVYIGIRCYVKDWLEERWYF